MINTFMNLCVYLWVLSTERFMFCLVGIFLIKGFRQSAFIEGVCCCCVWLFTAECPSDSVVTLRPSLACWWLLGWLSALTSRIVRVSCELLMWQYRFHNSCGHSLLIILYPAGIYLGMVWMMDVTLQESSPLLLLASFILLLCLVMSMSG